ncbi:unnamed protein product [Heligmosomoides polygyrus]|uniref:SCP domain-containing protein n=1 Tax=Heligmosomoides polygyrus TaxID=6339 RepID=A0A183FXR0_HELPZ|nr:unnamed protein product [Heligmosomoides polygyrus]
MHELEEDMELKVDGRLHHLRFADSGGANAGRLRSCMWERWTAAESYELLRNGRVSGGPFSLNGTNISECSNYIGREVNLVNDLLPGFGRGESAAWVAFMAVEEVMRKTNNAWFRACLFESAVFAGLTYACTPIRVGCHPALSYTSKVWAMRKQDEHSEESRRRNAVALTVEN